MLRMGGEISASSSSATPAPTSTGSKASTANTPNNTTPKSTPTLTSQNGRPLVCGPDELELPYPVLLKGDVCKGFGRGSKELGIPTANLPSEVAESAGKALDTGIYYGFASVGNGLEVWPMVMSFGWNPYYKNERRSAVRCSGERSKDDEEESYTKPWKLGGAHPACLCKRLLRPGAAGDCRRLHPGGKGLPLARCADWRYPDGYSGGTDLVDAACVPGVEERRLFTGCLNDVALFAIS